MAINGPEIVAAVYSDATAIPSAEEDTGASSVSEALALAVTNSAQDNQGADALYKPYCTIADVKAYVKHHVLDTAVYRLAINLASRHVENLTGKDFWYRDETYRVKADEITEQGIYLKWPVRELTSVSVNDSVQSSSSYFNVPITEDPHGHPSFIGNISMALFNTAVPTDVIQANRQGFPKKVFVTGKFGYTVTDTTTMPTDDLFPAGVRRATTIIAGALTNNNRKEEIGLDGQRQSLLTTEFPSEVYTLLSKHKRLII